MKDSEKTKEQLLAELARVRQRLAALEATHVGCRDVKEALQICREKLSMYMDSGSDGFLLLDQHLDVVDLRGTVLSQYGVDPSKFIGRNLVELAPYAAETERVERYQEVLRTGVTFVAEEMIPDRRFGGEAIRLSLRAFKMGDGMGIVTTDITERRRAEERLRQSETRYRLLAENVTDVIWTVDLNQRVTYVSPSVKRVLGYDAEEVMGQTLADTASTFQPILKAFQAPLSLTWYRKRGTPRTWTKVHRLFRKDGSAVWCESTASFLRSDDAKLVGILLGVTRDITQRKRSRDALRRSESQLRLLSRRVIEVQEEEAARIARELHDQVGQELVALGMEIASLAEQLGSSRALRERGMRALDLVDRLDTTVHRIAVGIRPEVLDDLGLVKAIQWSAEDFERRTGISCPADLPSRPVNMDDSSAICAYRIVQEALVNVWRHAHATQAKIKVTVRGDVVSVGVSDNGVGVDLKQLSDASSLGLMGMRERASLVGGRLSVRSRLGKGFSVVAVLPIASCPKRPTAVSGGGR